MILSIFSCENEILIEVVDDLVNLLMRKPDLQLLVHFRKFARAERLIGRRGMDRFGSNLVAITHYRESNERMFSNLRAAAFCVLKPVHNVPVSFCDGSACAAWQDRETKGVGPIMDTGPVTANANTGQREFGAREGQTDRAFSIPKNIVKYSQNPDSTSVF
jgi:hypothetical protein